MKNKTQLLSWKNLEAAFAGESMAYQKYMYFAKIARRNGDHEVADLFEKTAFHETNHAEGHLRHLYPMNKMTTIECLKVAVEGEKFEYSEMYPNYARIAQEEGAESWLIKEFEEGVEECKEHSHNFKKRLEKIGKIFEGLAKVEKEHHDNYKQAMKSQENTKKCDFSESNNFLQKNGEQK